MDGLFPPSVWKGCSQGLARWPTNATASEWKLFPRGNNLNCEADRGVITVFNCYVSDWGNLRRLIPERWCILFQRQCAHKFKQDAFDLFWIPLSLRAAFTVTKATKTHEKKGLSELCLKSLRFLQAVWQSFSFPAAKNTTRIHSMDMCLF